MMDEGRRTRCAIMTLNCISVQQSPLILQLILLTVNQNQNFYYTLCISPKRETSL